MGCMNDDELIAQRRKEDQVNYLINMLDPAKAPRLAVAANALRDRLLADPGWHPLNAAIATMLRVSDVAVKSADGVIRQLVSAGMVERRGEYRRAYSRQSRRWVVSDTREIRLTGWPRSEVDHA